jgi:hypothetical protein
VLFGALDKVDARFQAVACNVDAGGVPTEALARAMAYRPGVARSTAYSWDGARTAPAAICAQLNRGKARGRLLGTAPRSMDSLWLWARAASRAPAR